jgi:zinc and cadmium transporter
MSSNLAYAYLSATVISSTSLVGVLLYWFDARKRQSIIYFVMALAVGNFWGSIVFYLIPESYYHLAFPQNLLIAIFGYSLFWLLDKLKVYSRIGQALKWKKGESLAIYTLTSASIHSFLDGTVIAASYLVDKQLGIAATIGILCHEIPHELGKYGILTQSGYKSRTALALCFLSSLSLFAGLSLIVWYAQSHMTYWLIPFVAGNFLYLTFNKLMPILKAKNYPFHLRWLGICLGISIMGLVRILFQHQH